MTTRPPASQPVDHVRWQREREIEAKLRGDDEGTKIKFGNHPIWDNRWAVVFGTSLWGILVLMLVNLGGKVDAQNVQLSAQGQQLTEQAANTKILEINVNAKFEALNTKVEIALQRQNERIERIEGAKK